VNGTATNHSVSSANTWCGPAQSQTADQLEREFAMKTIERASPNTAAMDGVDTPPAAAAKNAVALVFPVSPDSPFPDGYDIASERDALADLVGAENADQSDPRWARLVELRGRESELREMSRSETRRLTPAGAMAAQAASPIAKMGQLADATPDTMTLHTKDAYRMFIGRPAISARSDCPFRNSKARNSRPSWSPASNSVVMFG